MKCPKCQTENPDDSKFCRECAASLTASEDVPSPLTQTLETHPKGLIRGALFAGRYKIIDELGKGGMGAVYRVEDITVEEEIALKLIKWEIAADKRVIERFRNELTTARKIRHKNICGMYDLNEDNGAYFITMEYVRGEDLKSFIRRSIRLSIPTALSIAKQICDGLIEAHKRGVVHRDLKPANIMIDMRGDVRIMDFGIARSPESMGKTIPGALIGTPAYMSPEQAAGRDVDHRTDIYSFGMIWHEMLTGKLYTSKKEKGIPNDIESIILRCLKEDREERFQTVREILDRVDEAEVGFEPRAASPKNLMKSIAVLPFADMSARKDQEYFCDGLSESIINSLTQIGGCRVVARTSAFAFKGKEADIREIGKKLNVSHILEGSVQKASKRLRITAQLISVKDGYHLWSERYDSTLDDVFAIQDEISLKIVENLKIKLEISKTKRLVKRTTEDTEAYNLYLKGRYHWSKVTKQGCEKALGYFQQVIEKDPSYALAYAGIAHCHLRNAWYYFLPPKEELPQAKLFAEKALKIDRNLSEAHSALATMKMTYERDWEGAGREFRQAAALSLSHSVDSLYYSVYFSAQGRHEEAIHQAQKALESDPISLMITTNLGMRYFYNRQFDKSLETIQKAIDLNPNSYVSHWYSFYPLIYLGKHQEALQAIRRAEEIEGRLLPHFIMGRGFVNAISGEFNEAEKSLEALIRFAENKQYSMALIAIILIFMDRYEEAFEYLEKAYEEFDVMMIWIKSDPAFERVASDPRYISLLEKVGLD